MASGGGSSCNGLSEALNSPQLGSINAAIVATEDTASVSGLELGSSKCAEDPEGESQLGTRVASAPAAATPGAAGEEPPVAIGPKTMANLSEVVLHTVLAYLDATALVECQMTCCLLATTARHDDLWRDKCLQDWGESRRVLPERRAEEVPTFLQAWRGWRRSFDGYDAAAVKRVALWWAGIEEWMAVHLPEAVDSLNIGVSEADLNRAEDMLGWALPTDLRLFYRFHNGQWLPWDEQLDTSLGVDEGRPSVLPEINSLGKSLGLLGGYSFYEHLTTCKLFSLQRGVLAGLATADSFAGENQNYFEAAANGWGIRLDDIRARGGLLLAASHDMSKRAWIGSDGNVRYDGKSVALWGVFDAAPVNPPSPSTGGGNGSGSVGQARRQGNLMTWLEEYLRRLRLGHYGVQSRWLGNHAGMAGVGPMGRTREMRGVWLFPQEGGEGFVTDVTKGVEIQVSPVFVPEECAHRTDGLWAYSVKMQLLRDHPSRPQSMTSCQLTTRHWEIDGSEGLHREVSGSGVIGQYPHLAIPPASGASSASGGSGSVPGPEMGGAIALQGGRKDYTYESCTGLDNPPGTMGGRFTFVPGGLSTRTGPPFDARVPTFDLVHPDFIF